MGKNRLEAFSDGVIWINHHAMIDRLRSADPAILMLKLLRLMSAALAVFGALPFAGVATLREHLPGDGG